MGFLSPDSRHFPQTLLSRFFSPLHSCSFHTLRLFYLLVSVALSRFQFKSNQASRASLSPLCFPHHQVWALVAGTDISNRWESSPAPDSLRLSCTSPAPRLLLFSTHLAEPPYTFGRLSEFVPGSEVVCLFKLFFAFGFG